MDFLKYISIRNRVLYVFIVWMLIFIGFGLYGVSKVQELGDVSQSMYEHSLLVSNAAREARVDIIKIQREIKDLLLIQDNRELEENIKEVEKIDERITRNLDIIKTRSEVSDVLETEAEIRKIFTKWQESRKDVIDLVLEGKQKEPVNIIKDKNDFFVKDLESKLDILDFSEKQFAEGLIKDAEDIEKTQTWNLIIWMISLSVLSLVLFIFVIRSILNPIKTLKDTMNASVSTGELEEVRLSGKNEIVEMSKDYNELIRKLQEQFWIKDSQNYLNNELAGSLPVNELAQKSMNFLSRAVEAGNGVFYIYNNEDNTLRLNASFAFTERDRLSNKYGLGESIVGQVALEKKPILIRNVRKSEAQITSGIIDEAPLNTYAFPLVYENNLYGVVELSSFEPFTPLKQELLSVAGEIVSINLYSAIQNHKIRELLEKTEKAQKMAETSAKELQEANVSLEEQQRLLQQQTEELQQTNVQLEEQQQLLQQQSEELQQTNSQLEEQQQMLEQQSNLLNIKNEEMEKSRDELIKRSSELEQSSKYKSEFLANMSHELRTPLNSIILLSKLLKRKNISELCENDKEKISVIYNSGRELLRLINDILDLSKIESGRMDLNIGVFNPNDLIENLKQMFDSIAKEKSIQFVVENSIKSRLIGDENRISQILRNFLSNAFKFTEEGYVKLKLDYDTKDNSAVAFSVSDTGVGLSADKLPIIFEEFHQGDGSVSRKYGGTGLGLSISNKLAELMNGEIEVTSTEGVGSTFSLRLPGLLNDEKKLVGLIKDKNKKRHVFSRDKKVILIIDDDEYFSSNISEINSNLGFATLTALSGKEGLQMARSGNVDAIILDLTLPDMSGLDVLRELKSTDELKEIPVHIVSASDHDDRYKIMGASGFLQKPANEKEIADIVLSMVSFTSKHLLVVEDNGVLQQSVEKLVRSDVVIKAVDSEKQVSFEISKDIYDAVVIDLELKNDNGINICKFIKQQDSNMPVIVCTGQSLTDEKEKDVRKYADSLIIKTQSSQYRLADEVTTFLESIKKAESRDNYMFSRMREECALSLDKKKILIVDDDPRNIFVLATALEEYGADIIDADNGKIALEKMKEHKIDLVLMDIMMPVMDGYETIRAIRNDEKLKFVPIIAITAKSLKGDKEKCIEVGANDYISKPVDYDVLIRLVKAWISK